MPVCSTSPPKKYRIFVDIQKTQCSSYPEGNQWNRLCQLRSDVAYTIKIRAIPYGLGSKNNLRETRYDSLAFYLPWGLSLQICDSQWLHSWIRYIKNYLAVVKLRKLRLHFGNSIVQGILSQDLREVFKERFGAIFGYLNWGKDDLE